VHLQRCNLFVIFVYLNYICGIVQVYLVIGLSFQCVVFLVFGCLCYMCVLCQVYVERILSFIYLYGLDMVFISGFKCASCLSYVFELSFVAFYSIFRCT
jgi:hypothetical protein